MNSEEKAYHEKSIQEAVDSGDQEAEFEARAEFANAKAWDRFEENGHW